MPSSESRGHAILCAMNEQTLPPTHRTFLLADDNAPITSGVARSPMICSARVAERQWPSSWSHRADQVSPRSSRARQQIMEVSMMRLTPQLHITEFGHLARVVELVGTTTIGRDH